MIKQNAYSSQFDDSNGLSSNNQATVDYSYSLQGQEPVPATGIATERVADVGSSLFAPDDDRHVHSTDP